MMSGDETGHIADITCDLCNRPAVYLDPVSHAHECASHFVPRLKSRVCQAVRDRRMVLPGDRIAIALSGGKDSAVLTLLLSEIVQETTDTQLIAVTVDEGIAGYRDATIDAARRIASVAGIEHRIVSFSEAYGNSLDNLVRRRESRSCSVCGVLRRSLLQRAAGEWGATKLATGHCLDDEVQSVLMNYLRGDIVRLLRKTDRPCGGIPRIKPLGDIPEKEVTLYAMIRGLYHPLPECPYARHSLRSDVRRIASWIELRHAGTMRRVATGQAALSDLVSFRHVPGSPHQCQGCGQPAEGENCRCCRLLKELRDQEAGEVASGNR